ncbi:hypothetical protein NCS57_01388800 [Fusarium keratoplasticum]|uniref:Uncharacterized protein n=1 Tax=Fusarium keratoplasticum TaxID=1328300 RepID=A0ACC0QDW9_9HYPO|nr:hypothetical protein NCS57_01388800 [Fusarium keratoplasticum]KAI8650547.1 hypothetical protein NCS57_01388800 [Fusarium keratoplasticum]KAI8651364.1 hypothetical protein NCS55_01380600 [Fusarium keratoplasticum]
MHPLYWLLNLCAAPEICSGAIIEANTSSQEPLPPSQDPWYTAPSGFESKQPGDVLRIRSAPGNLTAVIGNPSVAYHILYRTTDSRDQPSWAVTTLFIPPSLYFSPSGKAALLSYQFAYNSANLDSSPSIGLYWRMAQREPNLGIKSNADFINYMLSLGWIVNTPDFEGPKASFGASKQAGHATLDSLRAVRGLINPHGHLEPNTAIWGYSGGSYATLATAELQAQYAPEVKIDGTVLGGQTDNISASFDNLNRSPIAGTLIAFLLGVTSQYPEVTAYLESRLVPDTKEEFLSLRHINVADAVRQFSGKDIYAYLKGGATDLQDPVLRKVYDEDVKLGYRGVPKMPMFVYKAIADQFCPVGQTDATVDRFCRGGADITYERNTVGEHVSEIENGKPRAFKWLWSVFDESYEPSTAGCRIRNVTVKVDSETQ